MPKELNYTKEQEDTLKGEYIAKPTRATVNKLAKMLGHSERSVISKLSCMKIYITPERTTKSGSPIVRKASLAENIGDYFGNRYPSLEKANKIDLTALLNDMIDHFGELDAND